MVIDEDTVGLWFMDLTETSDWMGHLRMEGGRPVLTYRFRYYDPDDPGNDPFSGKDTKNWFTAAHAGTREEAIEATRQMVREMERLTGNGCHEILMRGGNVKRFMNALSRNKWAHLKRL